MTGVLSQPPRVLEQVAALPIRLHAEGFVEVLLISSPASPRWLIPQGWPLVGADRCVSVAKEVVEEAGVVGLVLPEPIGHFVYDKRLEGGIVLPCRVAVHVVRVQQQLDRWREKGRRERQWFTSREAAKHVCNLALQRLILKVGRSPELADPAVAARRRRLPAERSAA